MVQILILIFEESEILVKYLWISFHELNIIWNLEIKS